MTARLTVFLGTDTEELERAVADLMAKRLLAAVPVGTRYWPETREGRPLHPSKHVVAADVLLRASELRPHVVCTHSDPFVLRLRRRVAERAITPDDVALVWVETDGTQRPIALNDRGTPAWWPAGVFAEGQEEFNAIRRALAARDQEIHVQDP